MGIINEVPSLNYDDINALISSIPCFKEQNMDASKMSLVNSKIVDVINNIEKVTKFDDKKFRECFGRLNFRVNLLKQGHHLSNDISKKMDALAQVHGIVRHKPAITRLKSITKKVAGMINTVSKDHNTQSMQQDFRKSKPLSEEYWKEFFDGNHRHPVILDRVFNQWKVYGHYQEKDFWEYLAEIEKSGKMAELINPAQNVTYLTEVERQEYKCTLTMSPDGNEVIIKNCKGETLKDGLFITVLGPDGNFYAAEKVPGKFQHASFFAGKSVISAGMFKVKDGHIMNFISQSGHYKPEKLEMFKTLTSMELMNIDISKFPLIYGVGGDDQIEIKNPKEWTEYQDYLQGKTVKQKIKPSKDLINEVPSVHKIDQQAAGVVNVLGGGIYSHQLGVVLPVNPMRVNMEWEHSKNKIARAIGILPHPTNTESRLWTNSANSEKELLDHSNKLAPFFKDMCNQVALTVGGNANFGPGDKYIVKAPDSLHRKIAQDAHVMGISESDSLSKIGDALRGTLVVEKPEQIQQVAKEIIKKVEENQGKVVFKNLWEEDRQSGYVGVHAKIFLPLAKEGPDSKKTLIVELQIHLKNIMDGTEECVKERSHIIYNQVRTGAVNTAELASASKLLFLTALREYEASLQINTARELTHVLTLVKSN